MARLNIAGQVLYADFTPAAQASVKIVEQDQLENGGNDLILTRTTDTNGRFSGLSAEWNDREGALFGVDVPDVLQLTFTAKAGGTTHSGPFILLGGQAAPIVLPIPAPKPVAKAERELVQVIYLSAGLSGPERALYEFIESSAETLTQTMLGGAYRKITYLKGASATLAAFVNALAAAAGRSTVEAVDVILTTHGATDHLVFADAEHPKSKLQAALLALPAAKRKKLRSVFSTACFGETHLDAWIAGGFNEASGSEGIYADSAVSYAPFLAAWAGEKTFAEAVAAANAADAFNVTDNVAKAFYRARDMESLANQVDSDRTRRGSGASRIYSTP